MPDEIAEVEYLTVREVATLTRFTPDHIRRLCNRGKLPGAVHIADSWRIHKRTFLASIGATDDPRGAL